MSHLSELKKPINVISLLLGIIGIFLSIYFYYDSIKAKGISYLLNDQSSLIFDSKNSSIIKLYERDTVPITRNVYLLSGFIWNSGDLPIIKEDVRMPISLQLENTNRILDYKITKQKDPLIANFNLVKTRTNVLQLDWKYFDPNFGLSFQIIYEGELEPNFSLEGKILSIDKFKKEKINIEDTKFWTWQTFFFIIAIPVMFLMARVDKKREGKISIFVWFLLFFIILGLVVKTWIYFHSSKNGFPL